MNDVFGLVAIFAFYIEIMLSFQSEGRLGMLEAFFSPPAKKSVENLDRGDRYGTQNMFYFA